MTLGRKQSAFTLIELLVVVAIIALLISILIPSLNGAKEQAKRAYCLGNLKQIGTAIGTYSSEDDREHAFPIQQQMVTTAGINRFEFLPVSWFVWGGRNGIRQFQITATRGFRLDDADPVGFRYAARTRPLNRYLYGDYNDSDALSMPLFECPSDIGYPLHALIDDSPPGNAKNRCYDTLGNSYRGSFYCYINGGTTIHDVFTMSAWGHRASTLTNTGDLLLCGEPLFFNMIGPNGSSAEADLQPIILYGWHKRLMTDNLLYADASARSTQAGKMIAPEANPALPVSRARLLQRGPTWRIDCFPTPGAHIRAAFRSPNWLCDSLGYDRWPCQGYQNLMIKYD